MSEQSVANALARIDRALDRAETAARDVKSLSARHGRLKASVARSLRELDALLDQPPG